MVGELGPATASNNSKYVFNERIASFRVCCLWSSGDYVDDLGECPDRLDECIIWVPDCG